ncbi:MAG: anthranilate phosphoribosyltransferase [Gammaproteobacteria bacterium]|nr:anthranilate phosphoribosyltransferase [Gammaproteobacteria bacterium]
MTPERALAAAQASSDLDAEQMEALMRSIMAGDVEPATLKSLLIAWRDKGEAVSEIVGAARAMRACSVRIQIDAPQILDTCGTGGDGLGTFNVSTAVAIVAAAAGITVAKHGNRAVSSNSGSADVLATAGLAIDLQPDSVRRCIEEAGIGFLFAPSHHPAMRHAAPVRKEIGTRTLFNLLGPLTNPAGATHQLIGLFDARWLTPYAETLAELGSTRAMAVHSRDGMDELSLNAPTDYALLDEGEVSTGTLDPQAYGLDPVDPESLQAGSAEDSLAMIREAFSGKPSPAADLICLNAGAALHTAGHVGDIADGIHQARITLEDGSAATKLDQLAQVTQRLKQEEADADAG